MKCPIEPLGDRVVLLPLDEGEQKYGSIIIQQLKTLPRPRFLVLLPNYVANHVVLVYFMLQITQFWC